MSYKILTIPPFDKQLKRLAKKYLSLKKDFARLLDDLEQNPELGTPLGNNCYKIRIAISAKGKGKSGGARVITNFILTEKTVFLISIYDKSEKENLTDKELKELLKFVPK
jgi:mRNA-degrading endonuclease RelE of RelBE toxin-antitoxin system